MQILVAFTIPHRSRFPFSAQDMVVYHFYKFKWMTREQIQSRFREIEWDLKIRTARKTRLAYHQKQVPNSGSIGQAISHKDKAYCCFRWFWRQHWSWKRLRRGALIGKSSTNVHLDSNISLNNCDFCAKTCQSPPADHRAHTEPLPRQDLFFPQQPTSPSISENKHTSCRDLLETSLGECDFLFVQA